MTLIAGLLCLTFLSGCRAAYSTDSYPTARNVLLKVDYYADVISREAIEFRLRTARGRDICATRAVTGPELRATFSLEDVSLDDLRGLREELRQEPGVLRVDMEWSNGVAPSPAP